jgi:hypothetical protein
MNDGAILIGTINCGVSGKLESLLASDSSFIEFVSKDGQQRFMARHQVASIEPLGSAIEPSLPATTDDIAPFEILGLKIDDTLECAMAAFQEKLRLYNPERWSGEDIPFEFSRYSAEKTRQINVAFTAVRAAIQTRSNERKEAVLKKPFFGPASSAS